MLRFVSLFAGAGGLDLGLEYAGWRCDFATDWDADAVATLRANQGKRTGGMRAFENCQIEENDVRGLNGRRILSQTGKKRGDFDLLAGGPPCQAFSSAGHQKGFDDPRGRLFEDYVRLAKQIDARWLLFENVRGLVTARGADGVPGSALAHIRAELLRAGWHTKVDLFNAADFGVAQRRVRLVLIGYRSGDEPEFPVPTHADAGDIFQRPWVTLGKCLGAVRPPAPEELIRPNGDLAKVLANLPPGSGVKSPGKAETTRPGGHWGYKQGAFVADPSKPARTVTANSQQDWIIDRKLGLRRLSPRECAAIQSFPASWTFIGGRTDKYRLIGNAVPPLFAKQLGLALARSLSKTSEPSPSMPSNVLALPDRLQAAIRYTIKDEARNGGSRRAAPKRRLQAAARRRAG